MSKNVLVEYGDHKDYMRRKEKAEEYDSLCSFQYKQPAKVVLISNTVKPLFARTFSYKAAVRGNNVTFSVMSPKRDKGTIPDGEYPYSDLARPSLASREEHLFIQKPNRNQDVRFFTGENYTWALSLCSTITLCARAFFAYNIKAKSQIEVAPYRLNSGNGCALSFYLRTPARGLNKLFQMALSQEEVTTERAALEDVGHLMQATARGLTAVECLSTWLNNLVEKKSQHKNIRDLL